MAEKPPGLLPQAQPRGLWVLLGVGICLPLNTEAQRPSGDPHGPWQCPASRCILVSWLWKLPGEPAWFCTNKKKKSQETIVLHYKAESHWRGFCWEARALTKIVLSFKAVLLLPGVKNRSAWLSYLLQEFQLQSGHLVCHRGVQHPQDRGRGDTAGPSLPGCQ